MADEEQPTMQRVLVTQQAYNPELEAYDPLCPHSTYVRVGSCTIMGTNILRMVHDTGDVSMVVLGEGYTVTFIEDTDS